MRTACYARFSSDLQRETSLEDQIRVCREYAEQQCWTWQQEHIYRDAAISGASMDSRPGLQGLLKATTTTPPAFDVLLVDDSSRVARDLRDALDILRRLRFARIRVLYLSQGIDSDHEQAETLMTVHGLVDGLYLQEMSSKIRRGLAGQLTRGFATGGATLGYRTVSVPDPANAGDTLGRRVEIDPVEATWIRRIFEWFADGLSYTEIITRLNQGGAPAPRGGGSCGHWRVAAVRRLLANERYLGQLIWGRTRVEQNPYTRRKVQRPVPRSQWRIAHHPELRIVPDELWERTQHRRHLVTEQLNGQRQLGRTLLRGRSGLVHGRGLLTGFLRCGTCGRAISVVNRHRYRGRDYRYYGCANHAKNGRTACENRVTVRGEEAERALLAGLQVEVTQPSTVDYLVAKLSEALQAACDARPQRRDALLQQRETLTQKIRRLVTAVEGGTASQALLHALAQREDELAKVEAAITNIEAPPAPERLTVLPSWVKQQVANVVDLLHDRPERLRAELIRLGVQFTLHPVFDVPDGEKPYLRAVGEGNFEALVSAGSPFPLTDRSLHQADLDDLKGLYHVNLVDEVTQFQFIGSVEHLHAACLAPVLSALLRAFPFTLHGFHSDNGSEYVNRTVAALLEALHIDEFTKSRARHTNGSALVESKNGSVVRKHLGYGHIPSRHAQRVNDFTQNVLSPYLNFHRPCFFPSETVDAKGRRRKRYRDADIMTPYEKLKSLPEAAVYLTPGTTFQQLDAVAFALSDNDAARALHEARARLFRSIDPAA